MLCFFVIDQIAISGSPSDIVNITEGIDNEDVHEGGKHESIIRKDLDRQTDIESW